MNVIISILACILAAFVLLIVAVGIMFLFGTMIEFFEFVKSLIKGDA